ncbi:MAG: universal stress protein [Syntrophobacteraceae bacterium]|jgi:nucleotide-binding universal stress UspA family protein
MKVLVPVDGSTYSQEALKVAIDYVKIKGADLNVISVVQNVGGALEDHEISPSRIEKVTESLSQRAEEVVKQACDMLAAEKVMSVSAKAVTATVSVPDAIIDYAAAEGVDLIIMGSKGLSVSSKIKLGSVAAHVIKHCHCSVYLVKTPGKE